MAKFLSDGSGSGNDFSVDVSPRVHGTRRVNALHVDGVTGKVMVHGNVALAGAGVATAVAAGSNGAGGVVAADFKVGDIVVTALNLTDNVDDRDEFETVITQDGEIQQVDAGDLSTKTFYFQVARQSQF